MRVLVVRNSFLHINFNIYIMTSRTRTNILRKLPDKIVSHRLLELVRHVVPAAEPEWYSPVMLDPTVQQDPVEAANILILYTLEVNIE